MADWTGGATGAISGASAGSAFGPIGAGIGGVIGGVTGLFGGKKKRRRKVSSLDKRQQDLNEEQYAGIHGEGPLADLYDYDPEAANEVFNSKYAEPAYREFQEKLVPGITGQFRNKGLQNSSYVGDAITKLARDVQENLNSKRTEYLYNEQSDSRNSRRNAVENYQNRSTFAYDRSNRGGGFDINQVLSSITPEMIDQARNYFK